MRVAGPVIGSDPLRYMAPFAATLCPDPMLHAHQEGAMPEAVVNGARLSYDVYGDGEPVLLVCGTGQRAFTWQFFQVPALNADGYQAVTFDNRGIPPSDCPPAPYTVAAMAADAAGLIERMGIAPCRV